MTLDDAAALCLELPETTEGVRWSRRAWFVDGRCFAWERPFSKADLKRFGDETPPTLPIVGLSTLDLEDKEAILAGEQPGFFTIPHFDGYPAFLIELGVAEKAAVREALVDAWLVAAPPPLRDAYLAR